MGCCVLSERTFPSLGGLLPESEYAFSAAWLRSKVGKPTVVKDIELDQNARIGTRMAVFLGVPLLVKVQRLKAVVGSRSLPGLAGSPTAVWKGKSS
jgi:hypothetical protein